MARHSPPFKNQTTRQLHKADEARVVIELILGEPGGVSRRQPPVNEVLSTGGLTPPRSPGKLSSASRPQFGPLFV